MSGRGRLSSIELLGEDYDDIVTWASAELQDRHQLQTDILGEFNKRLIARSEEIGDDLTRIKPPGAGRGQDWPISKSAFGRHAVEVAEVGRRYAEVREISAVLVDRLQPGDSDDLTIALAQLIKTAAMETIKAGGRAGTGLKDLQAAGNALRAAEAALRTSTDRRQKLEEAKAKAAREAAAAVLERAEETAREAGLNADVIAQLRRDVIGVRDKPKAAS